MGAHARAFFDATHKSASDALEAMLEKETWKQVEVPASLQAMVDATARNQVPNEHECMLLPEQFEEAALAAVGAPMLREILIDGSGYKVVASCALLLNAATKMLQCVLSVQGLASQATKLLPALLKSFHTRAYQQVLMAGAMRPESAALRSISAKHLALSAQSLALVLALLPHWRAILAAYVSPSQRLLLSEFDSVSSDLERHLGQLYAKLVSIFLLYSLYSLHSL